LPLRTSTSSATFVDGLPQASITWSCVMPVVMILVPQRKSPPANAAPAAKPSSSATDTVLMM
jgi:hypothetical protein